MSDIGPVSRRAYEVGWSPVDWAIEGVAMALGVHLDVAVSRAEDPAACPGYYTDLTFAALARRIVGGLLDAGWTPPGGTDGITSYLLDDSPPPAAGAE